MLLTIYINQIGDEINNPMETGDEMMVTGDLEGFVNALCFI